MAETYFPGAIYDGSGWASHNRTGGKLQIFDGTNWADMKTENGGTGSGNPPEIYDGSAWKNQRELQ